MDVVATVTRQVIIIFCSNNNINRNTPSFAWTDFFNVFQTLKWKSIIIVIMKTIDAQGEENEPHKMHICCRVEVEEAYIIFYI